MRRFVALLSFAAALVFASPAAAQLAPPPQIILTSIDPVPMVALYDGGGGLPYLGSSTSYNAGDWENTLRAYHSGPDHTYDKQIAQVDAVAQSYIDRTAHASVRKAARARAARHGHDHGNDNRHQKSAIVLDVDET